jgi:hypothetical protein
MASSLTITTDPVTTPSSLPGTGVSIAADAVLAEGDPAGIGDLLLTARSVSWGASGATASLGGLVNLDSPGCTSGVVMLAPSGNVSGITMPSGSGGIVLTGSTGGTLVIRSSGLTLD